MSRPESTYSYLESGGMTCRLCQSHTGSESSSNSRKEMLPKPITIVTSESSSSCFVRPEEFTFGSSHAVTTQTPAQVSQRRHLDFIPTQQSDLRLSIDLTLALPFFSLRADPRQARAAPAVANDDGAESPGAPAAASRPAHPSGGPPGLVTSLTAVAHHFSAGGRGPAQRGPLQRPVGFPRLRGLPTRGGHEDYGWGPDWGCRRGQRRQPAGKVRPVRGSLQEGPGGSGDGGLRRDGESGQQSLAAPVLALAHVHVHAQRRVGRVLRCWLTPGDGQRLAVSMLHPHLAGHAPFADS